MSFQEGFLATDTHLYVSICSLLCSLVHISILVHILRPGGDDFAPGARRVSLQANSSSVCAAITVIDDALFEGPQQFMVEFMFLSATMGLQYGDRRSSTVTIRDNDSKTTIHSESW